jgi:ketosteroid isomerase-like protein
MIFGPADPNHPNVLTYLRAARAFRDHDLESIAATIHDSVSWHFPGKSWLGREIQGKNALFSFLREIMQRTARTFLLEDGLIAGTDHHVMAIQQFGATTREGLTQNFGAVSVMRFEDGRQIERWFYIRDIDPFDAFFGRF